MKTLVVHLRMYDPESCEIWFKPHTLRFNSKEEFKAEIEKLKTAYPRWDGEKPNG